MDEQELRQMELAGFKAIFNYLDQEAIRQIKQDMEVISEEPSEESVTN